MDLEEKAAVTSGSSFWRSTAVTGVPQITLTDGPHGVRKALPDTTELLASEPATCFPPAVALGSTWDPAIARRVGEALGDEALAMDVQVLLGPGINLKRSPLGGRNFEYFAEDPLLTGVLAVEWVKGLQSRGVGASLKHYAVNSQETDRMRVSADLDERTLRELYLRAFQRVVTRAKPWTVMCAYNRVNGVLASQHHWLLTEVLRGEWGYEGLVVSDWGAVADRVEAVRAGLDLTMPGPDPEGDRRLVEAVRAGTLDESVLDTAVSRVSALVRAALAARTSATYDADAHHALAREVAGRGIVLLKNDGGVLPLRPGQGTVAVLGEHARTPRFQGGGSSQVTPTRLDNALDEITALAGGPVTFAPGYDDIDAAVALARDAAVALVFAGTERETEGADRDALDLPAAHVELIERVAAVNPRTVVVLSNGAVVRTTPWDAAVPAVVEGWLLGQAGGGAIADVLFGRVNPSGRLTETIPLHLADHPSYLDFPGEAGHVRYGEGVHVGYRGFDARQQQVAYPFGHGLSYTTFDYGPATVTATPDGLLVRLRVTNTGGRDGREVVQAYVSLPGSAVRRPPRELKAFANVAVAAGATVEVELPIARDDLAYWDTRLSRWIVEGGTYRVEVGASSRDLRVTATADVDGDPARAPLTGESTIAEWLSDPKGAEALGALFASLAADGEAGTMARTAGNPEMLTLMGSLPLSRLAVFAGEAFSAAAIEQLSASVN
ncbi:glycoside hydrolase family 3 C-terminal domain-containing protein [Dactylosporangium aurantiacum]|uniref:Exo-alpha-(1->6)-L-arabinopyranosidase n=1 Tax=Dactylosporangium aurantiacum TaxID=35754 RepID=A0A9Q9MHF8_9ACTN|nr:glycoside hydrolase family 3 C-terminal domain-containing protein [Dactylosporangium aurantiacum]MDG6101596.1 glycoside hydrolase family 3 C-terminal domain-containing protein [Dactylosporangium aurantiacum]UWZ52571.1 glycoside hydrolase family 3 C-terminal domain-containing protein [Dactylosporangium aurantiacum]